MTPENTPLEITVYLKNGSTDHFVQSDPKLITEILGKIKHPSKLYVLPTIMIGSAGLVTSYQTESITRIDLAGPELPDWPYLQGAGRITETPLEEYYRERRTPGYVEARKRAWGESGTLQIGFTELELTDGQRLVWEVRMQSRELTVLDIVPFTHQLLAAGGLHALRIEGGVMMINPANVVRLSFFPGPPELPLLAWKADLQ